MRSIQLRQKPQVALKIAEALEGNPFLGKALVLGFKVLPNREFARFEGLIREGRVGEAGAFALAMARSPFAYKLPNRQVPRGGWKELQGVVEAAMGMGLPVVEAAIRLRNEGDEAEALFLLELLGHPEALKRSILALAKHLPQDRLHRASEVSPPFLARRDGVEVRGA